VAGLGNTGHGGAWALGGQGGAASSLGLEGADVQGGGVLALAVCLPGVLWGGMKSSGGERVSKTTVCLGYLHGLNSQTNTLLSCM
jgi:hypothetical protein